MRFAITNANVIDPVSLRSFKGGLLVENGVILDMFEGRAPEGDFEARDANGLCLAPGIVDIGVKVGEPGERHKESFKTASLAALAGGVTCFAFRPDTTPAIDSPETLSFAEKRAKDVGLCKIHPISALTKGRQGQEMVEIGFMKDAGAIAFSDGDQVIRDTKIAERAYRYVAMLDGMVIGHIQEPYLSAGAVATSGPMATKLGLSAVNPIAEKLGLQREMALVEICKARYHIDQVTVDEALPVLERAKDAGLDVTAGTSIHHLTLNQFDIGDYRTFFKLKPPLRAEEDREAMIAAIKSGLIDTIASFHTPQDEESKRLPFDEAASGAIGLETMLVAALRLYHSGALTLPEIFRSLSYNPANRFGLEGGCFTKGAPADFVLFDTESSYRLDRMSLKSKAKNTPFDEALMTGLVHETYVNGERRFVRGEER